MPKDKAEAPGESPRTQGPRAAKPRRGWSGAMLGLALGLAGMALARLGWLRLYLDVFAVAFVQSAMLSGASVIGLLLPRWKSLGASVLFVIALVAYGLWPQFAGGADQPLPPDAKRLRLAAYTLPRPEVPVQDIAAALSKLEADVLVLSGVTGDPAALRAALGATYPEQSVCGSEAGCDIAIFSRLPLAQTVPGQGQAASAMLAVRLGPEGGQVLVVGVHAARFPHAVAQYEALQAIANQMAHEPGPLLVAGDFNATPEARLMQAFATSLGLGITTHLPTYTAAWGLPQLAFDHMLAGRGVTALGPEITGAAAGSDHLPIAQTFAIPSAQN